MKPYFIIQITSILKISGVNFFLFSFSPISERSGIVVLPLICGTESIKKDNKHYFHDSFVIH